ncbi:MAG TPA: aspartate aminotransferase family protein [bacterium]|nr:aspartate aminotransferase family protein [bacterium]HPO07943.1 aspartate aminotransferase family protein [bacterium]HQO33041.1 aspartate aminotransferase family protein [bacterium]HQP98076.1 aspartate aminotransferase family protein [bacterium]
MSQSILSRTEQIRAEAEQFLMGNYGSRDLCLVRGERTSVWDADGNEYIDFLTGLAVASLGHCHPAVTEAICRQASKLVHVSNLYLIEPQVELARLLVEHSPCDKTFFCNSGTEANEAAIKLARRYSFDRYGSGRADIISLENSFHGRTLGALSATGQEKYHKGFEPLVPGFSYSPINNSDAMREKITPQTCAILVEPVQGEGGIHPCTPQFLRDVRAMCDEHDLLLIFDEVQCGLGRTGYLFTTDHHGIEPDMICLAKSLGSGVPIGALLAKRECASAFVQGTHAATFGGNPLACAAALATLHIIIEDDLPTRARTLGDYFRRLLLKISEEFTCIRELRIAGLMVGVELNFPATEIVKALRGCGVLAGIAGPNVLRFLPPLICEEAEIDRVVRDLRGILKKRSETEGS